MRRTSVPAVAAALLLAAAVCTSCSSSDGGGSADAPTDSTSSPSSSSDSAAGSTSGSAGPVAAVAAPNVDRVVATGLDAPWGLAFLPDDSALVSQRDDDRIVRVTRDGDVTRVGTVDGVDGDGEGGLLGIAVSPTYSSDHLLYAYFTRGDENVIARMTYDGSGLSGQQLIFRGIPSGPIHNGGRIAFGPDGMLYAGTGEAGRRDPAQDKDDLGGKILRLTPEGKPAPGNPFAGSPVWSYGHRNVQGLAWDDSGQLWASEFGQNTWDELNRIVKGGNYGWPVVEGRTDDSRFRSPARQWHTEDASPSGIAIAGDAVYLAALRGTRLWQVPVDGRRTGRPKAFFDGRYGRLRNVATAPDGSLWLVTNNTDGRGNPSDGDDRIIRLTVS